MTVVVEEKTILTSAARTATTASSDQRNTYHRGVLLVVDYTATPNNAETIQPTIQAKDALTGKYQNIVAFTAVTSSTLGASPTTATFLYTLYPGAVETITNANHEVQALALPRLWRVRMVHSASGSYTYTVTAVCLP